MVLEHLVAAFDLALRLRMAVSTVHLVDLVFLQSFAQIGGDVTRADVPR